MLEIPLFALFGNYLWLYLQRHFKWEAKTVVIVNIVMYLTMPIYVATGLWNDTIGLHNAWGTCVGEWVWIDGEGGENGG
jgi:hypothetical protein